MTSPRILFIHHALYIPHLMAEAFRELGHEARNLYFDFHGPSQDLTWACDFDLPGGLRGLPQQLAFLLKHRNRFDIFHFWARPYFVHALFDPRLHWHLPLDLALIRRAGGKIVFQSDGCFAMIRPSVWRTRVDPEICAVCQQTQGDTYAFCNDAHTRFLNREMEKYADLRLGIHIGMDYEEHAVHDFAPVALDLWRPDIAIPEEHVFRRRHPDSLLVFHGVGSHVIGGRGNIRGTQFLREAVQELRSEGYNIEIMHVEGVPNKAVRYYQAQADIVVDQLLFSGGGQTARESLAMGKPVLTRHDAPQRASQARSAAPHGAPPFVPTDRHNLKANIARMADDETLRQEIGHKSLEYARTVLSPRACALRLLEHYKTIL